MPDLINPKTGKTVNLSYDEPGRMEADRLRGEGWVDQEVEGQGETAMYKKIQKTGSSPYKMKKAPYKHLGSATHPTGAIAAHKGHMSKKMTLKTKKDQGHTLNQVILT